MTDSSAALSTLRVAHGQLVATLLADAPSATNDSAVLVTNLVRFNRLAAAQLQAARQIQPPQGFPLPISARGQTIDLARLLADLAASCAELGSAVRDLPPGVAWEQVESTLGSVIGQYRTATTLLHGAARA